MLASSRLQETVPAVGSTQSSTERRRSARVSEPLPLVIRGSDLLGQPFEERTSTLNFNLHGCRYSSKHHLPKNTWLTIETPKDSAHRNVRARVAWIQRPHSVREFFQIAVELESPENIWGLDSPPADWSSEVPSYQRTAETSAQQTEIRAVEETNSGAIPARLASYMGKLMTDIKDNSIQDNSLAASDPGADFVPAPDSPFLRELRAELNRHAEKAVESAAASAQERIRQNADEMEHQRQTASDESFQKWKEEFAKTAGGAIESELDAWRSRLRSEMNLAQAEWSELLQSSLDGSLQRLVEQLSQRSQEVQRSEESRMSERFADLIHPVNDAAAKAGQSLSEIRFGLETQVAAARSSLEEMERSATRIRENSAQFEAAGHDSLNELHRRLENVLDAQTAEMSRRVEATCAASRAGSRAAARTRRARIADGRRIAAASGEAAADVGE
jgi:PilZ domain